MTDIVTVAELTQIAREEVRNGGSSEAVVARLNQHYGVEVARVVRGVPGVQIRHMPSEELIDLTFAFDQS